MRSGSTLVHPLIFPFLFVLFITFGACASYGMEDLGYAMSVRMAVMVAIGMASYVIGSRYVLHINSFVLLSGCIALVVIMALGEHGIMVVPTCAALVLLHRYWGVVVSHALHIALAGMALLALNLAYVGYVPLLNPALRHSSQTLPFVFGYGLAFLGGSIYFSEQQEKGIVLAVIILLAVLPYGMRSYLLIFLLALCIESFMLGRVNLRTAAMFGALVSAIVIGLGFVTTALLPQEWHLSGLELVAYRIGFTSHMLDEACRISGWTGILHGELWRSSATSPVVGEIVAGSGNITTTVLGPLIVDGGVFELPLMAFAGAAVNTVYRKALSSPACVPYYALVFSIMILSIEISPVPILFAFLLFALSILPASERASTASNGSPHVRQISKE